MKAKHYKLDTTQYRLQSPHHLRLCIFASVCSCCSSRLLLLGIATLGALGLVFPYSAAAQSANAVTVFNGYNSAFLYTSGGTQYYKTALNNSAADTGWTAALDIQAAEDAYEVSGRAADQTRVANLCSTYLANTPTNTWAADGWNDDIGWFSLCLIRGYKLTGNTSFLNAAEYGFNMAFARGWDTTYDGGGIWELQPQYTTTPNKNPLACDSLATVAIYIYQCTGNTTYFNEANQIYDWVWHHLYNASTGVVYGSIDTNGVVSTTPHTYNQGTFADLANLLYESGAGGTYLNDAENAINYTIDNLTSGGILSDGGTTPYADNFSRAIGHICGYTPSLWSTYYPFMVSQCNAIWSNRRTDYNITWNAWNEQTPENSGQLCQTFTGDVAMEQFTPASEPPTAISGTHAVINKYSRLALDDPGFATGNGTNMDQWGYNGGSNQKWSFSQNSDGTYTILNQYSGLALDDPGWGTANGTKVDQWGSNGGSNQHWTVTPNQDGTYTLINKCSGLVLEDPGFSTANGTLMDQWENNNGANQRWILQ